MLGLEARQPAAEHQLLREVLQIGWRTAAQLVQLSRGQQAQLLELVEKRGYAIDCHDVWPATREGQYSVPRTEYAAVRAAPCLLDNAYYVVPTGPPGYFVSRWPGGLACRKSQRRNPLCPRRGRGGSLVH